MNKTYNLLSKYRNELFGLAICMIMIFHYTEDFHKVEHLNCPELLFNAIENFYLYIGSIGVEMFVFLSGMGLTYSLSKKPKLKDFYIKHFTKILVPYVIVGGLFWVMGDLVIKYRGISQFLRDFFFITFFSDGAVAIWYILFSLVIYAFFPLIYKFIGEEDRELNTLYVIGVYIALWMLYTLNFPEQAVKIEILFNRLLIFFLGVFFTSAIQEKRQISGKAIALLFLLYEVLLQLDGKFKAKGFGGMINRWHDAMWCILFMLAVCLLFELLHLKGNPLLCWMGKYTLELYLIHVSIRGLLAHAGYRRGNIVRYALLILASFLLAPVLSWITSWISRFFIKNTKVER